MYAARMHVCLYVGSYVRVSVCVRLHECVCICFVRMYVCMYVGIFVRKHVSHPTLPIDGQRDLGVHLQVARPAFEFLGDEAIGRAVDADADHSGQE